MKRFLQLSRSPFLVASAVPVLFGAALARVKAGPFSWPRFGVALLGVVAAHAGANLLNDYFDFRLGADRDNPHRNPFSGGSPHLIEGRERPAVFLRMAIGSLAVAATCGAWLAWQVDRGLGPVAALALIGAFGGAFYTAPPLSLSYRGWGEACIFACFGLLPVAGTWYVLTGRLTALPFAAALPLSFLITNIIWINQFPDCTSDAAAGKRTLVVRLGPDRARWVYHGLAAAAFAAIACLADSRLLGHGALPGLLGLPFSARAAFILHGRRGDPPALVPAQALTILAHLVTGVALCAGLLLL